MNLKFFLALSLFTIFHAQAIRVKQEKQTDITEQFCKATETPKSLCQTFQAMKRQTEDSIEIDLVDKKSQTRIGQTSFHKTKDNNLKIDLIEVNPDFQKHGFGSILLRYALSQCDQNCAQSILYAYAYSVSKKDEHEAYKKLEKFYVRHGGIKLWQNNQEKPTKGHFIFFKNDTENA